MRFTSTILAFIASATHVAADNSSHVGSFSDHLSKRREMEMAHLFGKLTQADYHSMHVGVNIHNLILLITHFVLLYSDATRCRSI